MIVEKQQTNRDYNGYTYMHLLVRASLVDIGLLIVFKNDKNDHFSFHFLFFSKNDRFVFWKKNYLFENETLVLNFQKTKNDRFWKRSFF